VSLRRQPRVVFLGNGYEYSLAFLQATVMASVELVGIVVPIGGQARANWAREAKSLRAKLNRLAGAPPRSIEQRFPWEVLRAAELSGAKVLWPQRLRSPGVAEEIAALGADVVVMAGFNEILRPEALRALPPVLNVHPSLLPEHRGPHPEFWTVASGAREGGVTLHLVDEGVDTGPIVAQERFPVEPWLTGGELQQRAMDVGAGLLQDVLARWGGPRSLSWPQAGVGSAQPAVQDEDLVVPFQRPAQAVYDLARAAAPWMPLHLYAPVRWCTASRLHHSSTAAAATQAAHDMMLIELREAVPFPDADCGAPGTLRRSENEGIAVACASGAVFFRRARVQRPG
jgi:methionyl-tRNA formyltransferase